jgi:hypothetical protein
MSYEFMLIVCDGRAVNSTAALGWEFEKPKIYHIRGY